MADADHGVSVLKREVRLGARKEIQGVGEAIEKLARGEPQIQWIHIGRCRAHYKSIVGE